MEDFLYLADKGGWLAAGAYYHTITSLYRQAAELAKLHVSSRGPDVAARSDGLRQYSNVVNLTDSYLGNANMDSLIAAAKSGGTSTLFEKLSGENFNVASIKNLSTRLTEGDPVHGLSQFGNDLIGISGAIFAVFTLARSTVAAVDKAQENQIVTRTANKFFGQPGALTAFVDKFLETIAPAVYLLLVALFTCGLTLAYYVPAIPFIVWIAGVIGWLLLVVELVVAAPFWIVAHAQPSGEGFAGDMGGQGYKLLLGILAMPFLDNVVTRLTPKEKYT
jgi:conjugal transfer/type IV secretion protein DotA/TraY